MKTFTFRTECQADNENVPQLLYRMKAKKTQGKIINDAIAPAHTMGVFTFQLNNTWSLENVREYMKVLIESDPIFIDMHRCYQTLAEGLEPNNQWYL